MPDYQKKADTEWARVIKEVGHCERCNDSFCQLHAHHLIKRRAFAYRHDLSNGICLCASCHTFAPYSAHVDNSGFIAWLRDNRPGQWEWYIEHTIEVEKQVGNEIVIVRKALPAEHRGDEVEYEELAQIGEK